MSEIVPDRRKWARLPVQLAVDCLQFGRLHTCNLTPDGMFIRTEEKPPRDTPLEFVIDFADGATPLSMSGRVVRAADRSYEPAGLGVEFTGLEPSVHDRLHEFFTALAS